jgi:hypothetical protein
MKNVIPANKFADRLYDKRKSDIITAVQNLLNMIIRDEDLKGTRENTTFLNLAAFVCDHEDYVPKGWLQHLVPNLKFNDGPDDDEPYSMPGTVFTLSSDLSGLFMKEPMRRTFITITCLPDNVDVVGRQGEELAQLRDEYLARSGGTVWSYYIFFEKLWHYLSLYAAFHIDESTDDRMVITAKNPTLTGAVKIELDLTVAKHDNDRLNLVMVEG